jgi:hypothetical protein
MPITGYRAGERCTRCTKDRTECGNCRHLEFDRRQRDRRKGRASGENNFASRDERYGEEVSLDRDNGTSRESSGTVESAQVVF